MNDFFTELRRRNVYKVAVAYAVISWLLIQAASILLPTFEAPPWVMKVLVVLLALGFLFAVFISWAFEMTPEGMKRTADISPGDVIPYWSKRKFAAVIVSVALLATGLLVFELLRAPRSTIASKSDNKSIAVLPLLNESGDPKDEYFSYSPSEKYSSFGSPLSFSSGRTAIDLLSDFEAIVDLGARSNSKTRSPVASNATLTITAANFRLLQYGMTSPGEISAVRFIPSGVISNAHEMNTAKRKPSARSTTKTFITHGGASKVGNRIEAA